MSIFQHRHYAEIANVLRVATKAHASRDEIINWLADLFASDNSRFDRTRFLAAVEGGKNMHGKDRR